MLGPILASQHNIRFSRVLRPDLYGADPNRTAIGPLSVEILEPFRRLRLRLQDNEWGLGFDLEWAAGLPAHEEIPNFSQLDEYIYIPKSTFSLGTRFFLRGPKTTYGGQGENPSPVDPGDLASTMVPNISRTYIDGTIEPDQRTVTVNAGLGGEATVPISPDGRTNTWSYDNASQLQLNGDISFHTYSSEITDPGLHSLNGAPNTGLELILDHDMGKLGKKIKWSITAGFSIADIHSSSYLSVPTAISTTTDTYDLFGQVPPSAPYSSPSTVSQTVFGAGGSVISGTTTTSATQSVVQQILLGNQPLNRVVTVDDTTTINRYFTEGAYYTLRVGPMITIPAGSHWKLNLSAGPDLIYLGSQFNVLEDLNIASTAQDYTTLYQKYNTKILPGYFFDVDLQYQLTDTAGFYIGGIYQGAGTFAQSMASGNDPNTGAGLSYTSKLDFGSQEGVKGGMTVRF